MLLESMALGWPEAYEIAVLQLCTYFLSKTFLLSKSLLSILEQIPFLSLLLAA